MKILLDMDEVLVDFVGGALRANGVDPKTFKIPPMEWHIHKWLGITEKMFWFNIADTNNFWLDLEPLPWKDELIEALDPYDVTLATSPSQHGNCASQKVFWMKKHLPEKYHYKYMIGSEKHLMANLDTILIDDSSHNIGKFIDHDGLVIEFPRPWNTTDENLLLDPVGYVISELNQF